MGVNINILSILNNIARIINHHIKYVFFCYQISQGWKTDLSKLPQYFHVIDELVLHTFSFSHVEGETPWSESSTAADAILDAGADTTTDTADTGDDQGEDQGDQDHPHPPHWSTLAFEEQVLIIILAFNKFKREFSSNKMTGNQVSKSFLSLKHKNVKTHPESCRLPRSRHTVPRRHTDRPRNCQWPR